MQIGIDLGTSEVKLVLVDDDDRITASAARALTLSRPHPTWSEQDPQLWWRATEEGLDELAARAPAAMASVRAIGLSGQMHGAVLLDSQNRVLRPAILWNDARAARECEDFETRCPESRSISGNRAMPGFTAPKLIWVSKHEPELFRALDVVLLPKDYLRLCLVGERISDVSDAAGTLWLDVRRRSWSQTLLEACGLNSRQVPALVEGAEPSGQLRPALAQRWGMKHPVVVAGGGADNAASAVGVGCVRPGQGLVSLGTSGVVLFARDDVRPNAESGIHTFCHALPDRWYQMSVALSATACLDWLARILQTGPAALLAEAERVKPEAAPLFLPYLSGERTPHNDPDARGVFFGLRHDHDRAALAYAVAEGVAFALADGHAALVHAGGGVHSLALMGGGARSLFWGGLLAASLECPLELSASAERGAAFGAARLGRLSLGGRDVDSICAPPPVARRIEPTPALVATLRPRLDRFRRLYSTLKPLFAEETRD
jgi:xylulokinase